MKRTFIRYTTFMSVAVLTALTSGCASMAVSGNTIEQNTATALGLTKGSFTISDRVDDGFKSNYIVKTNTGKQYGCYVTGTVSYFGRQVSDAVCIEANQSDNPAKKPGKPGSSCNALLKTAGKC